MLDFLSRARKKVEQRLLVNESNLVWSSDDISYKRWATDKGKQVQASKKIINSDEFL